MITVSWVLNKQDERVFLGGGLGILCPWLNIKRLPEKGI